MNMDKHKVKQTLYKEIFFLKKEGFFPTTTHGNFFTKILYNVFTGKKKFYQFKRFPLPGNNIKRNTIGAEDLTLS